MAGLGRVLAVYRLIERVRMAESMAASAEVTEAEQELERVRQSMMSAHESTRADVGDPILRAENEAALQSGSILQARLGSLRTERMKAREHSMLRWAESRLQVKQVEQIVLAAQQAAREEDEKREQSKADERFLGQRHGTLGKAQVKC